MFTVTPFLNRGQRTVRVDVARAAAVPQFGDVVTGIRIFVLLVRSRLEIPGVAAGAVRLVAGIRPGHYLAVADVTVGAIQVAPVLTREGGRPVLERSG